MKEKFRVWFIENKAAFFLCAAFFVGLIILIIDSLTGDLFNLSFWNNVLVEAHGMLMDIVLFGIILTLYERLTDKHREIERLHEEIDDYRGWNEPEAMYRIVGCIKRLNKKGVTDINLTDCFLNGANLRGVNFNGAILIGLDFRGADLSYANLEKSDLSNANLEGVKLISTNLKDATLLSTNLNGANLDKAKLQGANLSFAKLQETSLDTTNLNDSILYSADLNGARLWGTRLERAKILDLQELEIINNNSFERYEAQLIKGDYVTKTDYYEIFVIGNYSTWL